MKLELFKVSVDDELGVSVAFTEVLENELGKGRLDQILENGLDRKISHIVESLMIELYLKLEKGDK